MKKSLIIVVASILIFALTGCGEEAPKPVLEPEGVEEIRIEEIHVEEIRVEEIK